MKLELGDVFKVVEDFQFVNIFYYEGSLIGSTFKVTTIINDDSVLVQQCSEKGAVTHAKTKRLRNPDMCESEFTDYYSIIKTKDPQKLHLVDPLHRQVSQETVDSIVTKLGRSQEDFVQPPTEGIKSDGGSSSYYDVKVPEWLLEALNSRSEEGSAYIKTEELIEVVFQNDFDFGTNFKSSVRAFGKMSGVGKAGNTLDYECNKMDYYTNRIRVRGSRED